MSPANHAILALLWSSSDDEGNGLDNYDPSESLTAKVTADWEDFREQAELMGFNPDEHIVMMLHPGNEGDAWNAVAHDFILTRNGHGSGFWDSGRWEKPWGDRLTDLADSFGEIECFYDPDSDTVEPC